LGKQFLQSNSELQIRSPGKRVATSDVAKEVSEITLAKSDLLGTFCVTLSIPSKFKKVGEIWKDFEITKKMIAI
jgi:hypothetical protein